jgi:hypothetical protein
MLDVLEKAELVLLVAKARQLVGQVTLENFPAVLRDLGQQMAIDPEADEIEVVIKLGVKRESARKIDMVATCAWAIRNKRSGVGGKVSWDFAQPLIPGMEVEEGIGKARAAVTAQTLAKMREVRDLGRQEEEKVLADAGSAALAHAGKTWQDEEREILAKKRDAGAGSPGMAEHYACVDAAVEKAIADAGDACSAALADTGGNHLNPTNPTSCDCEICKAAGIAPPVPHETESAKVTEAELNEERERAKETLLFANVKKLLAAGVPAVFEFAADRKSIMQYSPTWLPYKVGGEVRRELLEFGSKAEAKRAGVGFEGEGHVNLENVHRFVEAEKGKGFVVFRVFRSANGEGWDFSQKNHEKSWHAAAKNLEFGAATLKYRLLLDMPEVLMDSLPPVAGYYVCGRT